MPWAAFSTKAQWQTFHDAVCADHGIPRPGYRQSDGALQIRKEWTNAWVDPFQGKAKGNVTTYIAHIPDEDVSTYGLDGFIVPDDAVTTDPDTGIRTVTIGRKTYEVDPAPLTWRKVKPSRWTDPVDDVEYDTATGEPT